MTPTHKVGPLTQGETMRTISNSDKVIDSRDIIARVQELKEERDALKEAIDEATEAVKEAMEAKDGADNQAPDADFDTANELDERTATLEDCKVDLSIEAIFWAESPVAQ